MKEFIIKRSDLRPMLEAPRDGTEILALHRASGRLHPLIWKTRRVINLKRWKSSWGVFWNSSYDSDDNNYLGWTHCPKLEEG
jgi:hypothetical protein